MDIFFNNIRDAQPVEEHPTAVIEHWKIIEYAGHKFLIGWLPGGPTIRRTSPIQKLDMTTRQITTYTGRVYQLKGPPVDELQKTAFIYSRLAVEGMSVTSLNDVTDQVGRDAKWWSLMQGKNGLLLVLILRELRRVLIEAKTSLNTGLTEANEVLAELRSNRAKTTDTMSNGQGLGGKAREKHEREKG